MRSGPWFAFVLACGCYGSAQSARVAQTRQARGWFCVSEPRVQCGEEGAARDCTGWDQTWYAFCGPQRYICRINDQRDVASVVAGEEQQEGYSCQRDEPTAAAPAPPPASPPPPAASTECAPPCRAAFVCVSGRCVSECNPPCPTGQHCVEGGSCVPDPASGEGGQ